MDIAHLTDGNYNPSRSLNSNTKNQPNQSLKRLNGQSNTNQALPQQVLNQDLYQTPIMKKSQPQNSQQQQIKTTNQLEKEAKSFSYQSQKQMRLTKSQKPKTRNAYDSIQAKRSEGFTISQDYVASQGDYQNTEIKQKGDGDSITNFTSKYNQAIRSQITESNQSPYLFGHQESSKRYMINSGGLNVTQNHNLSTDQVQLNELELQGQTNLHTLSDVPNAMTQSFYNKDKLYRVQGNIFVSNQKGRLKYQELNKQSQDHAPATTIHSYYDRQSAQTSQRYQVIQSHSGGGIGKNRNQFQSQSKSYQQSIQNIQVGGVSMKAQKNKLESSIAHSSNKYEKLQSKFDRSTFQNDQRVVISVHKSNLSGQQNFSEAIKVQNQEQETQLRIIKEQKLNQILQMNGMLEKNQQFSISPLIGKNNKIDGLQDKIGCQTEEKDRKKYFNITGNIKPKQNKDETQSVIPLQDEKGSVSMNLSESGNKTRNYQSATNRVQNQILLNSRTNIQQANRSINNNNNNNNSLLLNILNLKQLQAQDSSHELSQEKQSIIINEIDENRLTSIEKFFKKRKLVPDFQANQQNRQIVANLRMSRNNMANYPLIFGNQDQPNLTQQAQTQPDSYYRISASAAKSQGQVLLTGQAFNNYSQTSQEQSPIKAFSNTRKSFLDKQQKDLLGSMGVQNQYYLPGNTSKNFLEQHNLSQQSLRTGQNNEMNQQHNSKSLDKSKQSNLYSTYSKSPYIGGLKNKKKLNAYDKKEIEFQKVYEAKLDHLRKQDGSMSKFPEYKKPTYTITQPDISIYKERNDPYKVLSNRIKTRAMMVEHKYLDKNVRILEKFFDPLHIRLRVMPVSRAPLVQGKNSDYYFLEGSKLSLKGELTKAIEQLKKGLELKNSHFLCRFNLGVLQFKLGLLQEATEDFQYLVKQYGLREPATAYNLAVCFSQSGQYQEAFKLCCEVIEKILKNSNKSVSQVGNSSLDSSTISNSYIDKELLEDTFKLKGICSFRMGNALEAIRSFNFSNKYKRDIAEEEKLNQGKLKPPEGKKLESIYISLFIEETKLIFSDKKFQKSLLRATKSLTNLKPLVFEMQSFKRFGSQKDLKVKQSFKKSPDIQRQNSEIKKDHIKIEVESLPGREEEPQILTNINLRDISERENDNSILQLQQNSDSQFFEDQRPKAFSMKKVERNMNYHQLIPGSKPENGESTYFPLKKQQTFTPANQGTQSSVHKPSGFGAFLNNLPRDQLSIGARSSCKSPKSNAKKSIRVPSGIINNQQNQPVSQIEINLLKNIIGLKTSAEKLKEEKELEEQKQKFMEEKFYLELCEFKNTIVNAGSSIRFDRIYQLEEGDRDPNDPNPLVRKDDLTKEEKEEIDKRKRIEEELNQEQDPAHLKLLKEQEQQDKFLNFLLNANEIKMRELVGTKDENSMTSVLEEQKRLDVMISQISEKFHAKEVEWEKEFVAEQQRINNESLEGDLYSDDDTEGNGSIIRERNDSVDDMKEVKRKKTKETIIEKLNKSLLEDDITPDDIQNMLIKDMEERKLKESQRKNRTTKQRKRLTLRQVDVIRKEFDQMKLEESNQRKILRNLDGILSSLKFFQRFDFETRLKIYQHAEYQSLDAQTTIFNQGDVGDKLYVIIKGRVAVQVNSAEYGNLPVVVATLNDGEQFGELSLIKLDKLEDRSKQGEIQSVHQPKKQEFATRKASCITVEQTDLMALPKEISLQLYQPDAAPKKRLSRISISKDLIPKARMRKQNDKDPFEDKDELNKKINFLQSISLFEEIDAQLLMPIAVNMIPCTFNFGEYIIKEGEVPQGLYIVKSGQCKVACRRIAERDLKQSDQKQLNKKLGEKKKIKDKNPLFNEFDTENSILNEVKSLNRVFQNDRIYVSSNGEQVKGKIVYQDILTFSQLMPKNFFGGRTLLPFEMYMNLRRIFYGPDELARHYPRGTHSEITEKESEEKYQLKSLLSVIADAGQVEVYILDKHVMSYIPDFILRRVFEKIAVTREPDRPYTLQKIEEIKEAMVKWDKYKVNCVEKLFKQKQLFERNNQAR